MAKEKTPAETLPKQAQKTDFWMQLVEAALDILDLLTDH